MQSLSSVGLNYFKNNNNIKIYFLSHKSQNKPIWKVAKIRFGLDVGICTRGIQAATVKREGNYHSAFRCKIILKKITPSLQPKMFFWGDRMMDSLLWQFNLHLLYNVHIFDFFQKKVHTRIKQYKLKLTFLLLLSAKYCSSWRGKR